MLIRALKSVPNLVDTSSKTYRLLVNSPLIYLFNLIHAILIKLLVSILCYPTKINKNSILSDLTIIIKTFERPNIAQRLVNSIRMYYPNLKIVLADDSREVANYTGVDITLRLPYNTGVGFGRNAALKEVTTKYFLNLDDDFIFYKDTDLVTALIEMDKNPEIHIMGGYLINLPFFRKSGPGGYIYDLDTRVSFTPKTHIGQFKVYKKVPQFFIGQTSKVQDIGWDKGIKCLDHAPFFGRAYGKLNSVFNENLRILHARTPFCPLYSKIRNDIKEDKKVLEDRYLGYPPSSQP